MVRLNTYPKAILNEMIQTRSGEKKLGKEIFTVEKTENWIAELGKHPSRYAVFGIPEDIGVRANFGRGGTQSAWDNFLRNFINIQSNSFCKGEWITVLGALDLEDEIGAVENFSPSVQKERQIMFEMVERIDHKVQFIVETIVAQGRTPIIIGGGHNNAYGNIKGTAAAKDESINVVNLDAHTDLRPLTGRHSGNGFSAALQENFLDRYFIFGLHENYLSDDILKEINSNENIQYNTYEEIAIRGEKSFQEELVRAKAHISGKPFGIEIDLDSVPLIGSSAITSSGFSAESVRKAIHFFGKEKNAAYLHLCEGAPELSSLINPNLVGKLLSYMVTDFIKANAANNVCGK